MKYIEKKRRNTISSVLISCCTLLLLCFLSAELAAQKSPSALETLVKAVSAEIEGKLFRKSLAAVEITDVRSGKVLFSKNANLLLRPASNTKLFTSAALLLCNDDKLYFSTTIASAGYRTLLCTAGGDPLFSIKDIQNLAEIVQSAGIDRIDTLVLDPGSFDSDAFGEGWMWDDESDPFLPALSPFCIERNVFTLNVKRRPQPNDIVEVNCIPLMHNFAWTSENERGAFTINKLPRSNNFIFKGSLPPGGSVSKKFPMWQPREVFANALSDCLQKSGLADSTLHIIYGSIDAVTVPLGRIDRMSDEVLAVMNKESNNLCAEMVLRLLGLCATGKNATAAGGLGTMKRLFEARGLKTGGMSLVDGSGISFYNLTTAATISQLLRMMAVQPQFDRYRSSLAIAGVDGTLRNRLKDYKMGKYFKGKTGTLRGVSALSGYVQSPGGRLLTVVILMQNFTGDRTPYTQVQDKIVRHCIQYSASPAAATQSQ